MSHEFTVVREKVAYDPAKARARVRSQDAYWEEDILIGLADRVSSAMAEQNVTRAELARRLGKSPAYVTKLLRGHANMTARTMVRVARALDLRWDFTLLPQDEALDAVTTKNVGDGQVRRVFIVSQPGTTQSVMETPDRKPRRTTYEFSTSVADVSVAVAAR
ncbi:MAG: hypothetical protein BWK77_02585 [Verrucomicrobia bacterium A1]|nr:MAG: hypothetical protein BWK77_02585 [Verrucomicrobia bacterium A1]